MSGLRDLFCYVSIRLYYLLKNSDFCYNCVAPKGGNQLGYRERGKSQTNKAATEMCSYICHLPSLPLDLSFGWEQLLSFAEMFMTQQLQKLPWLTLHC